MSKAEALAKIFDEMANILEFLGDNPYRINTYRRVANLLSQLSEDLEEAYKSGRLASYPGVGSSTLLKVEEFLKTGTLKKYEELRKRVPEDLLELMEVPGIGPKTLKVAYEKLKVRSKEDFLRVLENGSLARLKGFGPKKVENIKRGLEIYRRSRERMFLLDAYRVGEELLSYMKGVESLYERISLAGSLRRRKETVGDLDLLIGARRENWKKIHEHFVRFSNYQVLLKGETKSSIVLENGRQVDLRTVEPYQWGSALQYFTGSKQHNIRIRDIAKDKGYKISEYGIFKGERRVGGEREEEIYEILNMQFPPPEIREDWGEVELCLEHKLPKLVEEEELRGDFHLHTNYSDGIDSLEEMVKTCIELGYEFLVVGDHSKSQRVARGLDEERFKRQFEEIERLRKKYKGKIEILKGVEVDILPDGSLDFEEEFLKNFDFVVASIHSRFNQDNTQRILKAMENPYVNLIGHPTGKSYGQREGYPLDLEKVLERARETQTALEINVQRIDLSPEKVRKGVKEGVLFALVSDAHSKGHLKLVKRLGVGIARRGFVRKEDLLNTRGLEDIKKFVEEKRRRFL